MRMLIQFNAVHRTVADNAQEKRCNKKRFVCIKKVDELESTILWIQFLCATFTLSLQKLVMPVAETYGQWILCRALIFNSLRIIPALVIRTPSSIYCKCNFLSVLENNLLFSVSRCHHIYIHSIPYRSVYVRAWFFVAFQMVEIWFHSVWFCSNNEMNAGMKNVCVCLYM